VIAQPKSEAELNAANKSGGRGGGLAEKEFADGGYVDRPTLALIGEGGEGEYVIPESKMSKFFNTSTSSSTTRQNVYVTIYSSDPSAAGRALGKELGFRGVRI
jgi:hypothetical protein